MKATLLIAPVLLACLPGALREVAAEQSNAGDPQIYRFEIPEGGLGEALATFGAQARTTVVVPAGLTAGKRAPRVEGAFRAEQALTRLLEGSGLVYELVAGHTFVILSGDHQGSVRVASSGGAEGNEEDRRAMPEVIVTGSLIVGSSVEKASPVTVTSAREMAFRQANVAEDLLREIPGTVPAIGAAVGNGTSGPSSVNLRGFGANRNLVLLDGLRLAPWGLDGSADLNSIPLALLERIDVLTGGASTTYGADAVAGVVNFVTRKDFTGVDLEVSGQLNERGDGDTARTDLTIGSVLGSDRGHIVMSAGYQSSGGLYRSARKFSQVTLDSRTGIWGPLSDTTSPAQFSLPGVGLVQIDPATGSLVPPYRRYDNNHVGILQTPFSRSNAYVSARLDLSSSVTLYAQALGTRSVVAAPFVPTGTGGAAVIVPYSNPFLPARAREQFCAANGLTPARCDAAARAVHPDDPDYATFTTAAFRRIEEAAARDLRFTTTLWQVRSGVRGNLGRAFDFDAYVAIGESDNVEKLTGNALFSRLQQSLLAADSAHCLDPSGGCVPTDLFGASGSMTAAQVQYLTGVVSTTRTRADLQITHANLTGELPLKSRAAHRPFGVALGTEVRRQYVAVAPDELARTPGELLSNSHMAPVEGAYHVREAFAEIIAPIIEDRALAELWDLEAGARYSDYSTAGGNFTWKLGSSWTPLPGIRLRGSYQRATRAPNIGELFEPRTSTLSSIAVDPCAGASVTAASALGQICVAQGAPPSSVGTISTPAMANVTRGGNPLLEVERGQTYSFGISARTAKPRQLGMSIDYYRILITDAISAPTIEEALDACFDRSLNPDFQAIPSCTAIRRDPVTGSLLGNAMISGVPLLLSNLGRLSSDGIDLSLDMSTPTRVGRLSIDFRANWTNSATVQATPKSAVRECAGFYSINCQSIHPRSTWSHRTSLQVRDAEVTVRWRHLSSARYEPRALAENATADPLPEFRSIRAYDYFDFSAQMSPLSNLRLTFSIQNVFDTGPPIVGSTAGAFSFNSANTYPMSYDVLGRRYGLEANVSW